MGLTGQNAKEGLEPALPDRPSGALTVGATTPRLVRAAGIEPATSRLRTGRAPAAPHPVDPEAGVEPAPAVYETAAPPQELLRSGRRPKDRTPRGRVWNPARAQPVAYASGGVESNHLMRVMTPRLSRRVASSGVIDRDRTGITGATARRSSLELRPPYERVDSNHRPPAYQTGALPLRHARGRALCRSRTCNPRLRRPVLVR